MSVFIKNADDSISKANIYVCYDRPFSERGQHLYLANDSLCQKFLYFLSEPEAREWLDQSDWISSSSKIYVLEIPYINSMEILLSRDQEETLVELADYKFLEKLYQQQYGENNDHP